MVNCFILQLKQATSYDKTDKAQFSVISVAYCYRLWRYDIFFVLMHTSVNGDKGHTSMYLPESKQQLINKTASPRICCCEQSVPHVRLQSKPCQH